MLVDDHENGVYERARQALLRKQNVAETPVVAEEGSVAPVGRGPATAARGERVLAAAVIDEPSVRPVRRQTAAEPEEIVAEDPPEQGRSRGMRPLQMLVLAVLGCVVGWLLASWLVGPRDARRAAVQTAQRVAPTPASAVSSEDRSKPSPEVPAVVEGRAVDVGPQRSAAERIAPAPSAAPAPVAAAPAAAVASQPAARAEADGAGVQEAVDHWRAALLSNDADRIAPAYASTVERYFLRTGVNRAYVRQYMQRQEAKGTRLTAYELGDETMHRLPGGSVEVWFVAKFTVSTPAADLSGHARTQLKLRQEDGRWRIFSERDFSS